MTFKQNPFAENVLESYVYKRSKYKTVLSQYVYIERENALTGPCYNILCMKGVRRKTVYNKSFEYWI
jgi:hypothetical protein